MVFLYVLYGSFGERNRRAFEDSKRSSVELKFILLKVKSDWMNELPGSRWKQINILP
jgi:hypothetical protein